MLRAMPRSRPSSRLACPRLILTLGIALASAPVPQQSALAQEKTAATAAVAEAPPEAPPENGPVAIQISAIAIQASSLDGFLRNIESSFESPTSQTDISEKLPDVERDIRSRARRLEQKLNHSYDRGDLDWVALDIVDLDALAVQVVRTQA